MKNQLLLLEDIDGLGRSGDLVSARPGFVRNFLLPQKKAVIANRNTVKLQAALQEERAKKAAVDKKEAESLALSLSEATLTTHVKVDPDGNLYGSVSTVDVARLLQEKGFQLDRKNVVLPHPIKKLGSFQIELKLKENVPASVTLEVLSQGGTKLPPLPPKEEKKETETEEAPE